MPHLPHRKLSGSVRRALLGMCTLLLAIPSFSQIVTPDPESQPEGSATDNKGSVHGVVINAATGDPVRRALVQIYLGPIQATLTDNEGRFQFDDLPPGQTRVSVTKPGYFSEGQISQGQTAERQISTQASPDSEPVVLRVTPEAVILGHVEADGEPLEGVPVKVMSLRVMEGRRRWEVHAITNTDEDGAFRMANLTPGSYYVAAGPKIDFGPQLQLPARKRAPGYAEVFYPGISEIAAAIPLELAPGQEAEADFSLKPEPIYRISGVVTGPASQGLSLQVLSRSDENTSFPLTKIDASMGKFEAQVLPGDYILRGRVQDSSGSTAGADLNLTVNSDRSDVRLVLGPVSSIPVSVRANPVNPLSAAQQAFAAQAEQVNVHLAASNPGLGAQDYYAGRGPRGSALAVQDIATGRYAVDVAANENWYVASAASGGTDLLREDLVVPAAGAQVSPIEIVLQNDGASLGFSVPSLEPGGRAAVLLVPERAPMQMKVAAVYQGNDAQISGLAPGDYAVLAFDRIDGIEYRNPQVLNSYLSKAAHVTLLPNGKSNVTTELIHAEN